MKRDAKDTVRKYFDHDAEAYLSAYSAACAGPRSEIFRDRRRLVLDLVRNPIGRVLDIGAGPGVFTSALLEREGECWVVDLSLEMIAAGRDRLADNPLAHRAHYEVADVERLPFRDRFFDTVVCVGLLQYLAIPDAALQEMARVTRPGGQILVTFPNLDSPLNALHRRVVFLLRGGLACLRRGGIDLHPDASRLTFREDIPNHWLSFRQIEMTARRFGLHPHSIVYHSFHFPFSIPGLRRLLCMWDRLLNRAFPPSPRSTWGREVIVQFLRDR